MIPLLFFWAPSQKKRFYVQKKFTDKDFHNTISDHYEQKIGRNLNSQITEKFWVLIFMKYYAAMKDVFHVKYSIEQIFEI